ncbi:hypothetical protein B0T16DRAFT_67170 [Cercophora newfieldiana]|uniref:Uncharacterized protein n=1 Tax=Cercophora newfieldiana TaxID=92897 RepID=A0AA39YTJ6_9PEZI|nr:hypothetical protein B0T16DRAFT_67170 [Cercophora newfieldiana]
MIYASGREKMLWRYCSSCDLALLFLIWMVVGQREGGRLRLAYVGSRQTDNFEIALTSRERKGRAVGSCERALGLRAGRRMETACRQYRTWGIVYMRLSQLAA